RDPRHQRRELQVDPLRHQERAAGKVETLPMKIDCTQLDDLLFDASPAAMEAAARHAEECDACAEKLAAWNDLSETAQTMRVEWQNDLLWPRIERALQAEKAHQAEGAARRGWGRSLRRTAAAFLLTASLGATVFYAVRVRT